MALMAFNARVRVGLVWDEAVGRWDYEVPELRIVGSGGPTRERAMDRAAESIAFALETAVEDLEPGDEVAYVPVAVGR
jgi:predicted RNase H-like HicB family nuclease